MQIASLLTYVVTSVYALEQALPQSGMGATKKSMILSGVQTLIKATAIEAGTLAAMGSNASTNNQISAVSALASDFIDQTVALLNKHKALSTGPVPIGVIASPLKPSAA